MMNPLVSSIKLINHYKNTLLVSPYNFKTDKKSEVRAMFNNIARSYDFLNHFLSFGIDIFWRRKLIRILKKYKPRVILDVATGTADLAIMASKLNPDQIIGVDLSESMIEIGRSKVKARNLDSIISLQVGDSEDLDFGSNLFDAVTVAFGVRNFENLQKGLSEIYRVLKPESAFLVLEFSTPENKFVRMIYSFYSYSFIPFVGKVFSKDSRAYSYLPESISEFPSGDEFIDQMLEANFINCSSKKLLFGISTIYIGFKR